MSSEVAYTIVLMNRRYSSWSMRAWLALKHCVGQDGFKEILINLAGEPSTTKNILPRADVWKYSPSGKAPALIDHELGVTVYESIAIVLHLADRFPQAHLLPADPAARAMCLSACAEMHAGFTGLRTHMPHHCLATGRKQGEIALSKKEVQDDIRRLGNLWTDLRTKYGSGGPFLFGTFGAADCMFAPVSVRFMTYDPELASLASFPVAQEYVRTLYGMDMLQEWVEEAKKEGPDTFLDYYEVFSDSYVANA
jgi:glutathione S-transferase